MAILAQATQEPPADLREHRAGTPAAVAEALMRAMSATPQARQRTASELMRELSAGFDAAPVEGTASPLPVANRLHSSPLVAQRPDAAEQHPARGRRTLRRPARAVAIGALAIATAAVVALVAGLGDEPTTRPRPMRRAARKPRRSPTPSRTPAASATPPAAKTTGRQHAVATATVRAFYRHAAARRYADAWRLAGPRMRQAFGNDPQRFARDLSSLRRIQFRRSAIVARDNTGATIEIETIATHDDRVDRCTGTLRTIPRESGGWLVEPAGVRCNS